MDYRKMSDQEINKAVHAALGRHDDYIFYDYCSSSAAAWPIITDNMIAIIPSSLKDGRWAAHINEWDYASSHENPLRAAMIVFLMMQESANVQTDSTR